jgi:hypothetical protein
MELSSMKINCRRYAVIAFLALVQAQQSFAQVRDPRCANIHQATAETASGMAAKLRKARETFFEKYGEAAFATGQDIATNSGTRTIGEIWSEILGEVGFPTSLAERNCAGVDFVALGIDQAVLDVLVLSPADAAGTLALIKALEGLSMK